MVEEWRDIKGFEGLYQVSNQGRVKSLSRVTQLNGRTRTEPEKIMSVTYRSGYPNLILRKEGKRFSKQVHRLVAEAFLPNPNNWPMVNHKDFLRTNNCVDNLEWCTPQYNVTWSIGNMIHPKKKSAPPSSGEKYIKKNINKRSVTYTVEVHSYYKEYIKKRTFGTIEEAIRYRDENLQKVQRLRNAT